MDTPLYQSRRFFCNALLANCLISLMLMPMNIGLAQIVPSGATGTHVSAAGNGHFSIDIAKPDASGISLNQYNQFSVGQPGATFLNGSAYARTIVNQVTSANRTTINGPIDINGPAAHLVIVNPNGITVDGGRFINTGGVALATGSVQMVPNSQNQNLNNVVVTTGSSDILVTGNGLSGAIPSLQLIAGKIKIDGPIVNSHAANEADIGLTAGNASLTLDSSVFAGMTLSPWASVKDAGGQSKDILIDVTPRGSLSASRVHMSVGAKGAGVSFAGNGLASIGEFVINANGQVNISGAQIKAEKAVDITGSGISVLNTPTMQSNLISVSGGVALLASAGDIQMNGFISGKQRVAGDSLQRGAVTLKATGDINILSESSDKLAIVFAANDDLVVNAGRSMVNDTGRLLSNARTLITAQDAIINKIDPVGSMNGGQPIVTQYSGHNIWFWPFGWKTKFTSIFWNAGSVRIPNQLAYIVGNSVSLNAASIQNSGEIDAQNGSIAIKADSFTNTAVPVGSAYYARRCAVSCSSWGGSSASTKGGSVNASGSIQIDASEQINNNGGLILAYGNMALNAPQIYATSLYLPDVGMRPGGLYNGFSGPTAFLVQQPSGGQFQAPDGTISVSSALPVLVNGGALVARSGLINPNGVVSLHGTGAIGNVAKQKIGLFGGLW